MNAVNDFWKIIIALLAAAALSIAGPALPDPAAAPAEEAPVVAEMEAASSAAEPAD